MRQRSTSNVAAYVFVATAAVLFGYYYLAIRPLLFGSPYVPAGTMKATAATAASSLRRQRGCWGWAAGALQQSGEVIGALLQVRCHPGEHRVAMEYLFATHYTT